MNELLCKINKSEFRLNTVFTELFDRKRIKGSRKNNNIFPRDIKYDSCIILLIINNTSILILGAIFRIGKECIKLVLEKLGAQQKRQNTSLLSRIWGSKYCCNCRICRFTLFKAKNEYYSLCI